MPATIKLNFEQIGAGPPVVILHGLFGSARNWRSTARKLADEFTVITVDLRNHGASPHAPDMSYLALAADVGALLERLDCTDTALIGHSMGGKTAMCLGMSEPKRIGRLVVIDIGPGATINDYNSMLEAMATLDMRHIAKRSDADTALAAAIPDQATRSFILQNIAADADGQWRWRLNLHSISSQIEGIVGAIPRFHASYSDGPVYVIRGANSDLVSDRELTDLGTLFPDFKLVTIADAAHSPHVEAPAEFMTQLRQILNAS